MSTSSNPPVHSRELSIVNKLGLHARAAAKLVTLAGSFKSDIQLTKGERCVNGKSMMSVLMLAAAMGSQVLVSANGDDAAQALEAITALIADRFGEEA